MAKKKKSTSEEPEKVYLVIDLGMDDLIGFHHSVEGAIEDLENTFEFLDAENIELTDYAIYEAVALEWEAETSIKVRLRKG